MNSPPSSRYRTARDAMTPTSESALEMGWVCTTRLMAHTTAMAAKIRKRIESMVSSKCRLCERHGQRRDQEVYQRNREHEGPGESHKLVITEARKRRANP